MQEHIFLLGTPRVEQANQPIQGFESRKALVLLGYLAAHNGTASRSQLAALFWPDLPEARGRGNLRRLLHNLTTLLPEGLSLDRQTVRLQASWIDSIVFDELAAQGTIVALRTAAELYRGSFLDGIALDDCPALEDWLLQEREHWHTRVCTLLEQLIQRLIERQEWQSGLQWVHRLLALDPWREVAYQQQMQILALSGQRDQALAQYEIARQIIGAELGLELTAETTALYEQIRDNQLTPRAAAPARLAVPLPATAVLGRDDELVQIGRLLTQLGGRLITLTGPGGVGKTRLALEAVGLYQDRFDDGAALVDLVTIHAPELVAASILQALEIRLPPQATATQQLITWLREKHLLLYLDNFEQVLAAAPLLQQLLAACPKLTLLVTSRIPLQIPGEHELPVAPLALPRLQHLNTENALALLSETPATALFVERARQIQPQFSVTIENAAHIAAICKALDGLPLAIELAAARILLFSPAALLARLERRLPLLSGTRRDKPPHQQTIRSTIAWSYQLLGAAEQRLFATLSVFVGGWSQALAEAVVGYPLTNELTMLRNHQLVVHTQDAQGLPRMTMLETIREYAQEQLVAEAESVRQRHAIAMRDYAEEAVRLIRGPQQAEGIRRFEREHENMRAALSFALEQKDADLLIRLGAALWPFWKTRSLISEGRRTLNAILTAIPHDLSDEYLMLVDGASQLAGIQGDAAQDELLNKRFLQLAYEREDAIWIARALLSNTPKALNQEEELAHIEAMQALFEEAGDATSLAYTVLNQGRVYALSDTDYEQAIPLLTNSLSLFEQIGDQSGLVYTYLHLGLAMLRMNSLTQALTYAQHALRLAWETHNEWMLAYALDTIGAICALSQHAQAAIRYFSLSNQLRAQIGAPRYDAEQDFYEQWVAMVRGQLGAALFAAQWEAQQPEDIATVVPEVLRLEL